MAILKTVSPRVSRAWTACSAESEDDSEMCVSDEDEIAILDEINNELNPVSVPFEPLGDGDHCAQLGDGDRCQHLDNDASCMTIV